MRILVSNSSYYSSVCCQGPGASVGGMFDRSNEAVEHLIRVPPHTHTHCLRAPFFHGDSPRTLFASHPTPTSTHVPVGRTPSIFIPPTSRMRQAAVGTFCGTFHCTIGQPGNPTPSHVHAQVNLLGSFWCCKVFGKHMVERGYVYPPTAPHTSLSLSPLPPSPTFGHSPARRPHTHTHTHTHTHRN